MSLFHPLSDPNLWLIMLRCITDRHDVIRDELRDLFTHVFSPSRIRSESRIDYAPMRINSTKAHAPKSGLFARLRECWSLWSVDSWLLRGINWYHYWCSRCEEVLWERATQAGSQTKSEREEKRTKYCKTYENKRRHFTTERTISKPELFSRGLQSCL